MNPIIEYPIIECRARHPEDSSVHCHYVTGHLSRDHVGFRMVNGVPLQIWRWR